MKKKIKKRLREISIVLEKKSTNLFEFFTIRKMRFRIVCI